MSHSSSQRDSPLLLGGVLALPLAGLALMLAVPDLDARWEHHPSHFWLVLGVAVLNVVLGVLVSEAARQRGDARLFLVSMVLLASAGFLALHALATPGVVLAGPNGGFSLATPVGLLVASAFAAASAIELDERRAAELQRLQRPLRVALGAVLLVWAAASLVGMPPLERTVEAERAPWLLVLLPFGVGAYAFAAWRYIEIYRNRRRLLPLAVASAFVLLAEALVTVAFGRAWHASWWEWHLLMAAAFGLILVAARNEYRAERSLTGAFGGLYLERTLEQLDARESAALAELTRAEREGTLDAAVSHVQDQGFSANEVAMLARSAHELARVDGLLRRYVGPRLAERMEEDPDMAELGGVEREVSVLFADLAGFTSFSEGRPAGEVVEMLNTYWAAVVPEVVERQRGMIERFAGDAVLAAFNPLGDQPDHALHAVRAAAAIRDASERLRAGHDDWPRFRVGVNSGPAIIGNVGAGDQRSFSVIGDTINVAARLQALAEPGRVVIGAGTFAGVRELVEVRSMGAQQLKGRADATVAFELVGIRRP